MTRGIGVGLAHHNKNFTTRITNARNPDFFSIKNPFITVSNTGKGDICGIRDATSGSVIMKLILFHRLVMDLTNGAVVLQYNTDDTSILPVSGAEQLNTSGARAERPVSSAI